MRLSLYRQTTSSISTQGELFRDGQHQAFTLERPATGQYHRIPAGVYPVELYDSPHFGRKMPLLVGTPGCPFCEIHWGNVPGASHCCILIGRTKGQDAIYFTRDAFDDLFPILEAALLTPEGCSIQVVDPPPAQPPPGLAE